MAYGIRLCRFHDASGSAIVKGRQWQWDFSYQFGPLFLDTEGEPLQKQPGPRAAVWKVFEQWLKELQEERRALREPTAAEIKVRQILDGNR